MLAVGVLGSVTAVRDDRNLEIGGPRQRAVLAMLVAAGPGRLVSVDRFVEDLWAGEPPPKALAALHAYISKLRRLLEPERRRRHPATVIASIPPGYRLQLPTDQVDAWHFESLVEQARRDTDPLRVVGLLESAEACWRGQPFAAYADQDWARPVAAALAERRAAATELRAAALLDLGQPARTIGVLLGHVRDHPLREQGVELLATALYRDGRQAEALASISSVRRALVDELGVDLGPRLQTLELDILAQASHLAGNAPQRRPASEHRSTGPEIETEMPDRERSQDGGPFLGRADELRRLTEAFTQIRERRQAGVVCISGEAGIGKSALAERFAELLGEDAVVARCRCPDVDGAPPGWPWLELQQALGRTDATSAADAFRLARDAIACLTDTADRPVLVVLEDLDRGDEETLQVLRRVLSSARQALLVVVTFRDDQADAALGAALAAVADRTVDRIQLSGLDAPAAAELLLRSGDRPPVPGALDELIARSEGNPLFLKEMAQLISTEGSATGLAVPPVIRDLLSRRIDRLPAPVVDLLCRAAALGRDVDLDLLIAVEAELRTLDEDGVLDALDAALVARLLEEDGPGSVRFAHALIRDTLHARLPPLRRRRLHQTVFAVLERDHPDRTDALAHHATAGLDRRTAPHALPPLLRAARTAAEIGVNTDMIKYARAAQEALDLQGPDPRRRCELLRILGRGLAGSGDAAAARVVRAEAVALAERHGSPAEVAELLTWDTPTVWTIRELGRVDTHLIDQLEHALAGVGRIDSALRIRLLSSLVLETESSPLVPRAEAAAAEAMRLAEETADPRLACQALNAAYLVTSPPRPPAGQREIGTELLAAARSANLIGYEAVAHHILFGAAAGDGDFEAAERHAAEAVRCAAAGQLPGMLAISALLGGVRALVAGDIGAADATYSSVAEAMAAAGEANGGGLATLLRFTLAHARQSTAELSDELADFESDLAHLPFRDLVVRSRLDAGDEAGAREIWARREPLSEAYLWDYFTALRAENAAQLGDLEECRICHEALRPFVGRFAGLSSGSMTLGPVDYFVGVTAAALGRSMAAAQHLVAAADLARRYGNQPWALQADEARRLVP